MVVHDIELVTRDRYPTLFAALEMISHDCGRQAGHRNYAVPDEWSAEVLSGINVTLMQLSTADLETFCIGEETAKQQVIDTAGKWKKNLLLADTLLQQFFEEFS